MQIAPYRTKKVSRFGLFWPRSSRLSNLPFASRPSPGYFFSSVSRQETVIYAGNVGDCRVVLCRGGVAIDLTSDHRPSREDETARVKEAGGGKKRKREKKRKKSYCSPLEEQGYPALTPTLSLILNPCLLQQYFPCFNFGGGARNT